MFSKANSAVAALALAGWLASMVGLVIGLATPFALWIWKDWDYSPFPLLLGVILGIGLATVFQRLTTNLLAGPVLRAFGIGPEDMVELAGPALAIPDDEEIVMTRGRN